jgi:trk system potassium uptake protein
MKYCVIGVGRFGYTVATTLANRGMEVLAVDSDEQIIESIKDHVSQAICIEVVDEETLSSIGLQGMDAVIVGIGEDFAQSILITALLKQNLKFPRVIVRAVSTIHRDILYLIGADQIVMPEQEMGARLADNLSMHFDSRAIITPQFAISAVHVPHKFFGKTTSWLHEQYHVIAVARQENATIEPIAPNYTIAAEDIILCAGATKDLEKIAKMTT